MYQRGDQTAGYVSLGEDVNKSSANINNETTLGVVSDKLPELELNKKDEDIIAITKKWLKVWNDSETKSRWEQEYKDNVDYWLGRQFEGLKQGTKNRANVDNIIFESVETYLPQVTRRNPEPTVALATGYEESDENQQYAEDLKNKLGDLADDLKLRLKLKRATRNWALYLLGIAKLGWDIEKDTPTVRVIRPTKIILDPDTPIDEDGYHGNRIGEYRKLEASQIIDMVESSEIKKYIQDDIAKNDLATEIQFIEWWTPEYMCWTLGEKVLLKKKNPHWNYDKSEETTAVDDYGNESPTINDIEGVNHFKVPKMPYEFLVVFNLGDKPMDNTSLIGQNLANQDRVNKRNKQIDANVDNFNSGMVVSLERAGLDESKAKRVASAIRNGGIVAIPTGNAQEAVYKPPVSGLPADVYNDLADTRTRIRDIFGTRGSTPAGIESETTVRGKILTRGLDTDRIGGGVTEYVEQFADNIYNWFVQLLYVYDDKFVGNPNAPKVVVSVKEGSLLPKDSTTIANQAIELCMAGKMSTVDMYKRLEYPNPEEMAANVWLEANAPELMFENNEKVQRALGMQQQKAQMEAEQAMQQQEQQRAVDLETKQMDAAIEVEKEKALNQDALSQVPIK